MERSAARQAAILGVPGSHAELLRLPLSIAMTTEMPDGRLQSTIVWFSVEGGDILVNTMREFRKARNLVERPRATVLVMEPEGERRWIEVRATVTFEERGAMTHLDALARAYCGAERYFGDVVPAELARAEHPVVCRLHPTNVTTGPTLLPEPASGRRSPPAKPTTARSCEGEPLIPESHRELLERPLLGELATPLRTGAQLHPTWYDLDGNDVLVNTTRERAKGRNLARDPRATMLVVDPSDTSRWIEIRGDVDLIEDGALEHLDRLTRRYTAHPSYYGHIYPAERAELETRVIARIHPRRVNVDAIHR
ncbi:MAG TPA: TIGR03618 family F420-dependent PPOX class oxidoreductase [Actinomycetota bacterium]|nr:TIGR03618 family F420-dependent PPOX class oxidoreductase [Actinomycetota bacterium]